MSSTSPLLRTKKYIKMCRVHTERFHWLCAHYSWVTTREENGSCNACNEQNAYRLEVWHNSVCPSCRDCSHDVYAGGQEPADDLPTTEARRREDDESLKQYQERMYQHGLEAEIERTTFKRRVEGYNDTFSLYQGVTVGQTLRNLRTGLETTNPDPELVDICVDRVPPRSLPWRFRPDQHLIDDSAFSSPIMRVVPPGTIPEDSARCGVCWGSMIVTGDEACEGGLPRMLPCGHIYGKQCIWKVFEQYDSCPLCTKRYRVRRQRNRGFVVAAIDSLRENRELQRKWEVARLIMIVIGMPVFFAATLTMDDGTPLDENDENDAQIHRIRQASLPVKVLIWLGCIPLSPAIYGYALWCLWTELH